MNPQSRTYNNGSIIEYTYTVVPSKGSTYTQTIYIRVSDGQIIDPKSIVLTPDVNSENSFQGVCCNIAFPDEGCEGWITEDGLCWITEDGLSWAV